MGMQNNTEVRKERVMKVKLLSHPRVYIFKYLIITEIFKHGGDSTGLDSCLDN